MREASTSRQNLKPHALNLITVSALICDSKYPPARCVANSNRRRVILAEFLIMLGLAIIAFLLACSSARAEVAASSPDATSKKPAAKIDLTSTPVDKIKVAPGFKVELVYSVPKESEGSWINMCVDPKGRLIVSDQFGDLHRVTLPKNGTPARVKVEKLPVALGQAQGLTCAFDSLYVVVNGDREKYENGLYRVHDTDGDDQYDSVVLLRELNGDGIHGEGEHGPHAVLPAPDGKSLYVLCGNNTKMTRIDHSRTPQTWDDDSLLPRLDGGGVEVISSAPAGCIYKIDPDGKHWELFSIGFRNEYDAAVNSDGELFSFDADAEQDLGTSWYRPTRVCHATSGSDWGWRYGSAKWLEAYPDTLPPVIDVGLGSPTGITFGYGAKFPARFQQALFLSDWTYGRLYAAHLEPDGASYKGTLEEFISGSPLPLTDVVVNPHDGAMYFIIGGRKVQSGLYRVTYVGDESTAPAELATKNATERELRRDLESLHQPGQSDAVEKAWPHLNHSDRFIRYAARTALEHCPPETWQDQALAETDDQAALTALLALVRLVPPVPTELAAEPASVPRHPQQAPVLAALARIDWSQLSLAQQCELLRIYGLVLHRLGPIDEAARLQLIAKFEALCPAHERTLDLMLIELLCYLQSPNAAAKGVELLTAAGAQEEQLGIAKSLRCLEAGWTPELRRRYFEWIRRAQTYSGGWAYSNFAREIKGDAEDRLSDAERESLAELLKPPSPKDSSPLTPARPFVKEWKMDELAPLIANGLEHRNFEHGKQLFAAAQCFNCHRFANEGGAIGPDLTSLAGRFSARDILESVLEPDKVISDQYAAIVVETTSGKVITGRIVNYIGDEIRMNTNMLEPDETEDFQRDEVEDIYPSKTSMMPTGLLNTLNEDEILDLMAFLLSRGNRDDPVFAPAQEAGEKISTSTSAP
jgi:putative heme-binding domain-containing protein